MRDPFPSALRPSTSGVQAPRRGVWVMPLKKRPGPPRGHPPGSLRKRGILRQKVSPLASLTGWTGRSAVLSTPAQWRSFLGMGPLLALAGSGWHDTEATNVMATATSNAIRPSGCILVTWLHCRSGKNCCCQDR